MNKDTVKPGGTAYTTGIDAAWTRNRNSALALVGLEKGRRKPWLVGAGRSYAEFLDVLGGNDPDWRKKPAPGGELSTVLSRLNDLDDPVTAVSLDIPLAKEPIIRRRPADDAISRVFGSYGASAHSLTPDRPGPLASLIFANFSEAGYGFASAEFEAGEAAGRAGSCIFFETYTHPAVITLLDLDYRHPYKVTHRHTYWPELKADQRWRALERNLNRLRRGLIEKISGLDGFLPAPGRLAGAGAKGAVYKGYENLLDALVCAWVAVEFRRGNCRAYGDETAAIWIPRGKGDRERSG